MGKKKERTFVKMGKQIQEFGKLSHFKQTGKVIDFVFFVVTLWFSALLAILVWASAGLALIWLMEKGAFTQTQNSVMFWVWFITPLLLVYYYIWTKTQKEVEKNG